MKKNKGKLGKDAGNEALIKSLKELIINDDKPTKKVITPTSSRLSKEDIKDFNNIKKDIDDDDPTKKERVMSNTEYQMFRDKNTGTVIIKPEEELTNKLNKINGKVLEDIEYIVAVILEQKEHLKVEVLERYIEGNPHLAQYIDDIKLFSGMTLVDTHNEIDYDDISKLKEHMFEKYELGLEVFKRQILKKKIKNTDWQIWKSEVLLYYLDQFLYKEYRVQFKDDMKPTFKLFFEYKSSETSKYNEFDGITIYLADEDKKKVKDNETITIYLNKAYIENNNFRPKDSTETNPDLVSRSFWEQVSNFTSKHKLNIAVTALSIAAIAGLINNNNNMLLPAFMTSLSQWANINKKDGAIIGNDELTKSKTTDVEYEKMYAVGNFRQRKIIIGTQKMYKNKRIQSGKFILLLKMCDKWLNEWLENIEIELGHPIPFMKEETREPFFNYDYDNEKQKQELIKKIQENVDDDDMKKYYIDKLNNWCHSDVEKEYTILKNIKDYTNANKVVPATKTTLLADVDKLSFVSKHAELKQKINAVPVPVRRDGGSDDYKSSESYKKAKKDFMDGKLSRDGFKKKKYDIKKEILNKK